MSSDFPGSGASCPALGFEVPCRVSAVPVALWSCDSNSLFCKLSDRSPKYLNSIGRVLPGKAESAFGAIASLLYSAPVGAGGEIPCYRPSSFQHGAQPAGRGCTRITALPFLSFVLHLSIANYSDLMKMLKGARLRIPPLSAWHWCEIFELPDLFIRPLSFMRMQPAVGSELCLILNRSKYQQRLVSVTGDEKRPKGAELWAPQIAFHLSS